MFAQQLLDTPQQVGLAQLGAGQVDREGAEAFIGAVPFAQLPAGAFQYPVAYLQDHAVFFRQRDEVFGRDVAKCRVIPANQRLGAHQAVVGEADFRLEGQ
ncbi:hypothetical protein D3C76_1138580 [compost metagenome]